MKLTISYIRDIIKLLLQNKLIMKSYNYKLHNNRFIISLSNMVFVNHKKEVYINHDTNTSIIYLVDTSNIIIKYNKLNKKWYNEEFNIFYYYNKPKNQLFFEIILKNFNDQYIKYCKYKFTRLCFYL